VTGLRLRGIALHEETTAVLPAAYPFLAEPGLGAPGVYVGRDLIGGSFTYDPFSLYAASLLTNPNMLVAGQVGFGKSSLVKTFLFRQAAFGRSAWVADPKGEYATVATALGATPLRLGPGLPARLNPLDPPPVGADDGHRLRLLQALAATALGRSLSPLEHAALGFALDTATAAHTAPVLGHIVHGLLHPSADDATSIRLSAAQLAEQSRDTALVLRRMCRGDLAGMFDAPTTAPAADDTPLFVLDLSAVYQANRDALPLVLACATSWLQAQVARRPGQRFVVIDEAWALLSHLATARWLQQSFKLSRAHGVANVAVLHRLSDLTAAGDAGSQTVELARGLLADTGTRVIYNQSPGEMSDARRLLGLTGTESNLIPQLRRGVALWKVAARSFLVEHRMSSVEAELTNTDQAMVSDRPDAAGEAAPTPAALQSVAAA
jgi:type IV secretory pathway VirB4 component